MTTIWRKLLVLGMVAVVRILASVYEVVCWLVRLDVPELADRIADRYLTPTALTIVIVLVVLLPSDPRRRRRPRYTRPRGCRHG